MLSGNRHNPERVMTVSRRSLLGLSMTVLLSTIPGCSLRPPAQNDSASDPDAVGSRGAADVRFHNLYEETVTVSVRAESTDAEEASDSSPAIDETVDIRPAETHTIHNKVLFGAEYRISVSLGSGYEEAATWTPGRGGGLHLLYDGSPNVDFAEGFA